jgi:hypothetical protein
VITLPDDRVTTLPDEVQNPAATDGVGQTQGMVGVILILIALVIVLPVVFIVTGGVIAVILGHSLRKEGEYRNEGSELTELNI